MKILKESKGLSWVINKRFECPFCSTEFMCESISDYELVNKTLVNVTCPQCKSKSKFFKPSSLFGESFDKEFEELWKDSYDKVQNLESSWNSNNNMYTTRTVTTIKKK